MKKVIIYSTANCHYCLKAKEWFAKNKISYTNIDVGIDHVERRKMVELSGQLGVPVISVEGEFVVGFDENKLGELLEIK